MTNGNDKKTPAASSDESVRMLETIIERVQAEFDAQGRAYTPQLESALNWLNRQRAKQ